MKKTAAIISKILNPSLEKTAAQIKEAGRWLADNQLNRLTKKARKK
jgi:hypothetical protein